MVIRKCDFCGIEFLCENNDNPFFCFTCDDYRSGACSGFIQSEWGVCEYCYKKERFSYKARYAQTEMDFGKKEDS